MKISINFFPSIKLFQGRPAIKIKILAYESSIAMPELNLIFECTLGSFVVNGQDTGQKKLLGCTDGSGETSVFIVGPDIGGDGKLTVSFQENSNPIGHQPYHFEATAHYALNFNVISDYAMADGIQSNKVQAILTGTGPVVHLDNRKLNLSITGAASFEQNKITQDTSIETDSKGNANFELYDTNAAGETVTLTGVMDGSKAEPTIININFQANLDCEASPPSDGQYIRTIFVYAIGAHTYLFRQRQCDHLVTVHKLLAGGLQGEQVSTGQKWVNFYDLLFPFTLGDEQYVFGLANDFINPSQNDYKSYWIIAKLDEKGHKIIVDHGHWDCIYDVGFAYRSGKDQFIYLHSKDINDNGQYPYIIQKILPDGKMARTPTEEKSWDCFYGATFFFSMEDKEYIYIHTKDPSLKAFAYELNKDGTVGEQSMSNTWEYYYYPEFAYYIGGTHYYAGQRFYDNYWFISYIKSGGVPEAQIEGENKWDSGYQYMVPFSIDGNQYFLRQNQSENHWYITQLIVGTNMGDDTDNSDNH
ncbi:Ig-like domain-containing protein [Xenorhabdus sp. KK7.4]|uniref:Ig-like domain-containing protein n=1 Tax=Xenorhabdus sp. KK7.4 TaxID=1851572 RepID=UPI000C041F8D|nr:Ig-like domain-containing protein [Xenorhabdus sp. KK7.4]PHM53937.1 hypothetical protein Xekk_02690 [Xenorhabdus sp. KK7.4]